LAGEIEEGLVVGVERVGRQALERLAQLGRREPSGDCPDDETDEKTDQQRRDVHQRASVRESSPAAATTIDEDERL
jgi:hypothetical protein